MKAGILYGVYYGDCANINYSARELFEILKKAAQEAGATIIGECGHDFSPEGASALLLLAESHYSVHTFPEDKKATASLHTCGSIDSRQAIYTIAYWLGAREVVVKKIDYDKMSRSGET